MGAKTWMLVGTNGIARESVYDVNTIANCDPGSIPLLDSPVGSVFERAQDQQQFVQVHDWKFPE